MSTPFTPGSRVVVLGAGATRGATTSRGRVCLPPLNADFFTQLQRVTSAKHRQTVRGVVEDLVDLFGANFELTMEEYFTQLESIARVVQFAAGSRPAIRPAEIAQKRDRLMTALAAVLEESTDVSRRDTPVCDHHRTLVASLEAQDTIITFNYDCVVDHALRTCADGVWGAKYGYGFGVPGNVTGYENWDPPSPARTGNQSIHLLKLHGSINWQIPDDVSKDDIRLKQRLYQQRGTPRFTIIPPEWAKNVDSSPTFRRLWSRAETAIRSAKSIALVGFSFTPTDMHVESLFRLALARQSKLETLIIANPSREHRRRIRRVFTRPLERGVVVRQYEGIAEFARQLENDAW